MSNLDIHHRAYPLLDLRLVVSLPKAVQKSTINAGDHNSTLKSTSLYGMFADNKIARASLKAADESNHPDGLIRNFNSGSAPCYLLKWITRGQSVRFYWTLDRIYDVSRAHMYVHACADWPLPENASYKIEIDRVRERWGRRTVHLRKQYSVAIKTNLGESCWMRIGRINRTSSKFYIFLKYKYI